MFGLDDAIGVTLSHDRDTFKAMEHWKIENFQHKEKG